MTSLGTAVSTAAKAVFNAYEGEALDAAKAKKVSVAFKRIVSETRFYQISTDIDITQIYGVFRKDIDMLDMLLSSTAKFGIIMGIFDDKKIHERVIDVVARAWSEPGHINEYDEPLTERAPEYDFCKDKLKKNTWLLFLVAVSL